MNKASLLAAVLAASLAPAVFADTFTTFNIDASLQSGTVSGTVTEDITTGAFTASNITALYSGVTYHFTGAPTLTDVEPQYDRVHFADTAHAGYDFGVDFFATTPVGYNGGSLCSVSDPCTGTGPLAGGLVYSALGTGVSTVADAVTLGSLDPVAATPEPSSLALLGTGALATIGAVRRRLSR